MISIQAYRAIIGLFLNNRGKMNSNSYYKGEKVKIARKSILFTLFMARLYLLLLLVSTIDASNQSCNNKVTHIKYGNKQESIKVMHWNKGPSLFKNKIDHLKIIIDKYKPHIISISETKL